MSNAQSGSIDVYLTPEQVAERLPFGNADWVRMQLRAGRLTGSKIGGRWLVEEDAIDEMVRAASNAQTRRRRRRRAISADRIHDPSGMSAQPPTVVS